MQQSDTEVLFIGAGLTSLTAAFYLKKKGIPFRILEKYERAGGVIKSVNENGFIYETGPNTGVITNTDVVELFDDLSGRCKLETANPAAKRRLIWKEGNWHPLPAGLKSAINTPLFTRRDKIKIMAEPFRKKGKYPMETLSDLVKRRMGKSFLDYAVDPFISGIYAGDPDYLVTKYALPKLYNLEQTYGSFIRGAIMKKFEPKNEKAKKVSREVFSAEGGLGNLVSALEQEIGRENIFLNAQNIHIEYENGMFNTQYRIGAETFLIRSEKLITTVYAGVLKDIFTFAGEKELFPLSRLKYAKIVQVIAGFNEWKGMKLNAFGGLVPSVENRKILGVLFPSSFLKNRSPEGGALLSIFLGGIKKGEIMEKSDEEITAIAGEEIKTMLQLEEFNPDILHIFRYMNAIPQYGKDSEVRLKKIYELQNRFPGLILAGNIRDGIGMADRIQQGRSIAYIMVQNT